MTEVDDTEMRIDLFRNEVRQSADPSLAHTHTSTLARLTTAVNENIHITSHIKLLDAQSKENTTSSPHESGRQRPTARAAAPPHEAARAAAA